MKKTNPASSDATIDEAPSYGVVGYGRVGRALAAYLEDRKIPFKLIKRESLDVHLPVFVKSLFEPSVQDFLPKTFLLALGDPALQPFVHELVGQFRNRNIPLPELIHFSGSVQIPEAHAFHPLYSFTQRSIPSHEFESIPFVVDPGSEKLFREVLPDFKNPVFETSQPKGALYHALCVCLGNLPQYIQNSSLDVLKSEYGLPLESTLPFLRSLLLNLESQGSELVSGPIARKDRSTLDLHLRTLEKRSGLLFDVYQLLSRRLL